MRRVKIRMVLFVVVLGLRTLCSAGLAVELHVPNPYGTIQAAVDAASEGDEIIVSIGTYYENINFGGKNIILRSTDSMNPAVLASTIIDGRLSGSVVTFSGTESPACMLSGFTITNGRGTGSSLRRGGGIYGNGTLATIQYNIISGNYAFPPMFPGSGYGGGLYDCDGIIQYNIISDNEAFCDEGGAGGGGLYGCDGTIQNNVISGNSASGFSGGWGDIEGGGLSHCYGPIQNNTIFGNSAGDYGGGLSGCNGTIINCIIWQNTANQGAQLYASSTPSYSCIQDWTGGGIGNINYDPCFVDAVGDDYHLSLLSPCIDAGDPCYSPAPGETDIDGEPRVINGHVDIGADEVNNEEPLIGVTPGKVAFLSHEGGPNPEPQILSIWNAGADVINWQIIEDCRWLEAWPTNGVSTGQINEVTLTVDASALSIGSYTCTLEVHDLIAINSPQTVYVTLNIFSEVVYVPSQISTIQGAIDHVLDGGTVIVADGIYTGEGNRDIDFRGKAITVRSENGPENCIIDCQDSSRAFYFHNGEDANSVLDGFTIINGYATKGGGMFNEWSNPTLTNCIFSDNSARYGGGIWCQNSSPIITYCIFTNNLAAKSGGGMNIQQNSNPTLVNCRFIGNSTGSKDGGGMQNWDSNPTLIDCIFRGNSANGSYSYGGGISNYWSNPTLTNCVFESNSSDTDGGGVCNYESSPVLTNGVFVGNSAGQNGGGMAQWYTSRPTIKNCTFSRNLAISQGGGLHNRHYSCSPTLTNCILWGDIPTEIYLGSNSAAVITYSAVQGDWPGIGNINADPCFVEPNGDYHLMSQAGRWDPNQNVWVTDVSTSPCIDAGDPNSDWTAELWPHGKRINMGAYGGTPQASMSLFNLGNIADLNTDDSVGYADMMLFKDKWLYEAVLLPEDLSRDGIVDFTDFAIFADTWLWTQ